MAFIIVSGRSRRNVTVEILLKPALLSFFLRSRFHPCPRLQTRVACRTSEFSCLVRVVVYRASPSGLSACSPGCNQLSRVQTKKLARIKITLRKMILPEERVYSTFPLFLVFLDEASLNQGKEKTLPLYFKRTCTNFGISLSILDNIMSVVLGSCKLSISHRKL